MPSDFNHIDEFFRAKEEESTADTRQQEKHWQQMKDLLVVPGPPTVKIRTINTRLYWQAAAGIIISAVFAFLLFVKTGDQPEGKNHGLATNNSTDTTIRGNKDSTNQLKNKLNDTVYFHSATIPGNKSATIHLTFKRTSTKKDTLNLISVPSKNTKDSVLFQSNTLNVNAEASIQKSRQAVDRFFDQMKKPAQEFYVNSKQDTTIRCSEGTTIFIPANSFQTALGMTVSAFVKLSVREFYSFADIISNKLSTTSDGEALITGGMLYLEAKAGNEVLKIKPGASLDLQIPTKQFDPQMQLFTAQNEAALPRNVEFGDTAAFQSTGINWIPAGQQQLFYANKKKLITVLNLGNNPEKVFYKHEFNPSKMKSVAKFVIPWYCTYSTAEIKMELEKRFSRYYDEIRVKRESKPWSAKARKADMNKEARYFFESPFVGDTVTIHIRSAMRLKYITIEDSLRYEAKWKQELEDAIKRKRAYSEFMQLNDQYDFKISALGWINCDRFLNYPEQATTKLNFLLNEEFKDTYFHSILVFNKTNVLMQGNYANDKISFQRIPKGQSVSLVCIGIKNGKLITCIRNLIVQEPEISDLQFTETNPEELKEKLRQFGTVDRRG